MKIITFSRGAGGPVEALTLEEFRADQSAVNRADEWVWQEQPSKEAAIANHEKALAEWEADTEALLPTRDTYPAPELYKDTMTMRDHFAARAMQGLLAACDGTNHDEGSKMNIAASAFLMADAMLRERARGKEVAKR